MKLTEHQINELYIFTRKHYVYHYDVQTELVDHLANDIERIWIASPKISFEEARDTSFKKFGVFGFMDVITAKQKQMNKRYWKIIWRFVKEWFTPPKLLITVSIFISVYILLQFPISSYFILGALSIGVIAEIVMLFKVRKQRKFKEENKEKIFLLEDMIGSTKNGYTGLVFINLFNIVSTSRLDFSDSGLFWQLLFSGAITLLIILFNVVNNVLPQKAQELLEENHPEYTLVKKM
jgi:uncharacterized integral membrane protein